MNIALFVIFLVFNRCLSVNILILSNLPSPSHHIWHKGYALELVRRGHNVTILTHEEEDKTIANYSVITLEGIYPKLKQQFELEKTSHLTPFQNIRLIIEYELFACRHDLTTKGLKTLLEYPKNFKFDLIILNLHTGRCLYPIIDRFNSPPIIGTSPFGNQPYIGYVFGNPISTTIPFYHFHTTDKMSFMDRLENFFYVHYLNFRWRYYMFPEEHELSKSYFGSNIKQIYEYEKQISLLLANSDPVVNYPQLAYPNIIPVAGIHIMPPRKLDKDLKEILDNAKHGVVLVAFGTNLDIDNMETDKRSALLAAFRTLPQTILLKTKSDLKNLTKNIITKRWLSQNDVLAHPNVRLFVTHGGALGTQEAMYHGVPIVGMPFFLDQHGNLAKMEIRKLGKIIKYSDITFSSVYGVLKEVLQNPIYRRNMQKLSRLFRDQPQTPLERAMFWTEYVLRHGGAEHLNPVTRNMNILQRLDLDIYAVILMGIFGLFIMSYMSLQGIKNILYCYNSKNRFKEKHN